MSDDETLTMRAIVIGGQRHADDYQAIWRNDRGRQLRRPHLHFSGRPRWGE
jgi:hypothetical protein